MFVTTVVVSAHADETGSAAELPKAAMHADRAIVVHTEQAHVLLEGTEPGLTFHLHITSATDEPAAARPLNTARAYQRLCTAPCRVELPAGSHGFALSRVVGDVAEADQEVIVHDGETIRGTYRESTTTRTVGWILLPSSIVAGGIVVWAGVNANNHDRCTSPTECTRVTDPNIAIMVAGGAVAIIGSVLGWKLAHVSDWASIEIIPSQRAIAGADLGVRGRF